MLLAACSDLLRGPLLQRQPQLPISVLARLGDLRARFLAKAPVGQSYRWVARNGRVLAASRSRLEDLIDMPTEIRIQPWHRRYLSGSPPALHGLLLCLRPAPSPGAALYVGELVPASGTGFDLELEVGGGFMLAFRRS
jgi:hypothetical protein